MSPSTYSIRKHASEWRREHLTLRGLVTMPVTEQLVPAVIFAHGLTGNKAESNFWFRHLSDALAEQGYATIRFDFAGSGESDGEFVDMTLSSEVKDMLAVWDAVQVMEGIDPKRVSLLGFSLGGAVSLVTAEQLGDELDRLILLAPAAGFHEHLIRDLQGDRLHHLLELGWVEMYGQRIGKGLFDDSAAERIYETAERVQVPTVLLHGTMDPAIPPYVSHKLQSRLSGSSKLVWIEGADHVFSQSVHSEQVQREIIQFLRFGT